MVEDIASLKINTIIGIGACGSINADIPKGSQVFVRKALITNGTSKYYTKNKSETAGDILVDKMNAFSQNKKIKSVNVASVDALYKESFDLLKSFSENGADIVNMESATFCSVSNFSNL